jgi:glycosyltransferase involved in cell wall biosynthesis
MQRASDAQLVSVLMPSLNQCDFIEVAVRSVFQQDEINVELIIADGGSSDGTLRLLEKLLIEFCPRLRWVSAADSGPANAINRALACARGDIIGWLNADDMYAQGAISVAVQQLAADGDLVMVYGEAEHVDATGRALYRYPTRPPPAGLKAFQAGCFICQPTVFLRRSVFDKLGGLDEKISTAFDLDLWLRIFSHFSGQIGYTDKVQAYSRLHGRTITSLQRRAVASEAARILSRYLGHADPHWVLTYIDEATRVYPAYECDLDFRNHVSAMIAELASCFEVNALHHLRSLLDHDKRLTAVPAGVHSDMFPDGWSGPVLSLRIRSPLSGSLCLKLQCEINDAVDPTPVLSIRTSCGGERSLDIRQPGQFEIAIVFADVIQGQLLFASVSSSSTFVPMLAEHGSTDSRELSFLVTRITWS